MRSLMKLLKSRWLGALVSEATAAPPGRGMPPATSQSPHYLVAGGKPRTARSWSHEAWPKASPTTPTGQQLSPELNIEYWQVPLLHSFESRRRMPHGEASCKHIVKPRATTSWAARRTLGTASIKTVSFESTSSFVVKLHSWSKPFSCTRVSLDWQCSPEVVHAVQGSLLVGGATQHTAHTTRLLRIMPSSVIGHTCVCACRVAGVSLGACMQCAAAHS